MVTIWAPRTKKSFPFYLVLFSHSPRASQNFNPVHSGILLSERIFCLPLLLPPYTVPCKIFSASPADLDRCTHYFNLTPLHRLHEDGYKGEGCWFKETKKRKNNKDLLTFVLLEAISCWSVDLLTCSHGQSTVINKSLINADCSRSSTGTYSGLKQNP